VVFLVRFEVSIFVWTEVWPFFKTHVLNILAFFFKNLVTEKDTPREKDHHGEKCCQHALSSAKAQINCIP
jgi:hypothetical protein